MTLRFLKLVKNFIILISSDRIPVNKRKGFTYQRPFRDIEKYVISKTIIADGAHIIRRKHNGLGDVVAHQWVCQPIYAFILKHAFVNLENGMVYLPSKDFHFFDTCWGWYKPLSRFKPWKASKLDTESALYVATQSGYHGIMEDLSAILMLRDQKVNFKVVVPLDNNWLINIIDCLLPGVRDTQKLKRDGWLTSSQLVVTTKSAMGEFVNPSLIKRLNNAVKNLPDDPSYKIKHTKIFISRADTTNRRYADEDQIFKKYQALGYVRVELANMQVYEQIKLFEHATHVAGFHGAGFTNLVWCQQLVHVHEYYTRDHFNSCFSSLAEIMGHHYTCSEVKDFNLNYS